MRNVQIKYPGAERNFESASLLALQVARENQMQDPTIMAWHQSSGQAMPPFYDGADPETWWAKYGAGNGGRLEVCVGEDYQFIMMDARGYEKLGEMPLRNLSDGQGNEYLCFTPMLGKDTDKPTLEACTHLDGWAADQY
ncbi:MAG: AF1514 family protein [Hydrogenophilaceae bacterium]